MSELPPEFRLEPIETISVDDALTSRLGRFVMQWAYAETLVTHLLACCVKADACLLIVVTNDVSAASVAGWVRALVKLRCSDEETCRRISDLLDEVGDLRSFRNRMIHGLWSPKSSEAAEVQTIKLDRSEIIQGELVTAHDLDDAIERARHAAGELAFLTRKIAEVNLTSTP